MRRFGSYQFSFVDSILLELDKAGKIKEYLHELPPGVRGNRFGAGPFCRLKLPYAPANAGVYAITVGDDLKYIGECESLSDRFGPRGYGVIAARNCHHDGQSTNCKVNSLILKSVQAGERIEVWFNQAPRRQHIEAELLALLQPSWNGNRLVGRAGNLAPRAGERGLVPSAEDFRRALQNKIRTAREGGRDSVQVLAGELHRQVGGYPGQNHRMPTCCGVMRSEMCTDDIVVNEPPQGFGASLEIRYILPRP